MKCKKRIEYNLNFQDIGRNAKYFYISDIVNSKIVVEYINSTTKFPNIQFKFTRNGFGNISSNLSGYIYIFHNADYYPGLNVIRQSAFNGSYTNYDVGPTIDGNRKEYGKYILDLKNRKIYINDTDVIPLFENILTTCKGKNAILTADFNYSIYTPNDEINRLKIKGTNYCIVNIYDYEDCKFAIKSREKYYNDISINNYNYDNNTYNNTSKLELNNDLDITDLCKDIIINGETFKPISKFGKFRIIKEV